MRSNRAHISIRAETFESLNLIRAPGQSYDGIIQQLIEFWDKRDRLNEGGDHRRDDDIKSPRGYG